MNTPSHHRVHHATNPLYLDRNYAGVFIIWDKMFGTFQPELDDEPCRYGIVKNLGTYNPIKISLHEWWSIVKDMAGAKNPKHARLYLLAPPGWSPDGSRATSEQILARWKARHEGEAKLPDAAEEALRSSLLRRADKGRRVSGRPDFKRLDDDEEAPAAIPAQGLQG